MATTLTVTQVNTYLKSLIDDIQPLRNVYIVGEISNFKHYYQSGHMYFTLKDEKAQLKCVMFSYDNASLKFTPENGMGVICFGQISVYERDGVYQLYVKDMQPRGVGSLQIAYEQLKDKLSKEGLFDDAHKKRIPDYPNKIGVATSNMGAAVEDIKNVISRRYPVAEIIIVPTVVQGDNAAPDIVKSIEMLDNMGVDTIIVGRGGGSIEDLWAFNTEEVARAVYLCKTPIISAVGHETDFTICDFVADLRAPTPSAGAELAVPNIINELTNVMNKHAKLEILVNHKIEQEENRLEDYINNSPLGNINAFFELQFEDLKSVSKELQRGISYQLESKENALLKLVGMLNALSPLKVIARGYSIVEKDNSLVALAKDLKADDKLNIRFKDGSVVATVNEVNVNE